MEYKNFRFTYENRHYMANCVLEQVLSNPDKPILLPNNAYLVVTGWRGSEAIQLSHVVYRGQVDSFSCIELIK